MSRYAPVPIIPIVHHCFECGSRQISRVKNRIGNGAFQVWDKCDVCGKNARGSAIYIPHKQAGKPIEEIPVWIDYASTNPPCVVCGKQEGTELHHFAPRHIFGYEEAEQWPKEYLCPNCHRRWHETIAKHYINGNCRYCTGLAQVNKEKTVEH